MLSEEMNSPKATAKTDKESPFSYGPPKDDAELDRLIALTTQTYLMNDDLAQRYRKGIGAENFRAVRVNG